MTSILYSKFKRGDSELNNEGFLLIDTLLTILTFSIIVTILVPSMIALHQTEALTEQTLKFKRDIYITLINSEAVLFDDEFFNAGVICRHEDIEVCTE